MIHNKTTAFEHQMVTTLLVDSVHAGRSKSHLLTSHTQCERERERRRSKGRILGTVETSARHKMVCTPLLVLALTTCPSFTTTLLSYYQFTITITCLFVYLSLIIILLVQTHPQAHKSLFFWCSCDTLLS